MLRLVTILVVLSMAPVLRAQGLEGKLIDGQNEAISNAKILCLGSNLHSHSSNDGKFKIEVTRQDTLLIEKEGFFPSKIVVQNLLKNNIIVLERDLYSLEQVEVFHRSNSLEQVANVDLAMQPNRSTQELLTMVPGLFIAQHAGGGKSEQMFLRGFDLDHGTDISIGVDNMPVNAVSHAHGQGYTDLHFVLPELIDRIEFGKGPYSIHHGNFATAGYVNFKTKDRIEQNKMSIGYGMFNSKRVSGLFKLIDGNEKHSAFLAGSLDSKDGYFESSQNFRRLNVQGKYSGEINETTRLSFSASAFKSSWDASGQIPERAVNNGLISRFGAIDDTEGGITGRRSIQLSVSKFFEKSSSLKTKVYFSNSDFELYSNFTFYNRDSLSGDQIRQKETRSTYGFSSDYSKKITLGEVALELLTGVGMRTDHVSDLELSYTKNRTTTLKQIQLGNLSESNYFAYLGANLEYRKIQLQGGIRGEEIVHGYENALDSLYNPTEKTLAALLPKIIAEYGWNDRLSLFAKWGVGFHSNDSRLVLDGSQLVNLPLVRSTDIGFEYKPTRNFLLNVAVWQMSSEQEFVYVGDEGNVETNGNSRRKGLDFGVTYQPISQLFINLNANYSHARYLDSENSYIPLAAPLTASGSVQLKLQNGIRASWNSRLMGDRPANESNTVIAQGYFINDLSLGWKGSKVGVDLSINNLFDVDWKETQFLTESRLQNESAPIEEIHFTPGTPRSIQAKISCWF